MAVLPVHVNNRSCMACADNRIILMQSGSHLPGVIGEYIVNRFAGLGGSQKPHAAVLKQHVLSPPAVIFALMVRQIAGCVGEDGKIIAIEVFRGIVNAVAGVAEIVAVTPAERR